MADDGRTSAFPQANSPQLLTRLLEAVARGVRTTRGLQEAVGVQAQTARGYVHAGQWLGLLAPTEPVELTPLGLEYVYAGPRRPQVYARAVWAQPFAAGLLIAGDGRLPEPDAVERAVLAAEPDLAEATVHRRAGAVRSLIAPVIGRQRPRPREQEERQLALPLGHAPIPDPAPSLPPPQGEHDPDAYRYVLAALLDHGELSLGQLRALLDRAGASTLGLGGLIELAVSRGDAARVGERLVVTAGAVARRELAGGVPSVILTDPLYRAWLADAVAATTDRKAEIRRDAVAHRFRSWDRRLFGHPLRPQTVVADLERVLMDRPLEAFPVAQPGERAPATVEEPFLDVWEQPGLLLALPPYLAQLQGGVAAVNRLLKNARLGSDVTLPDLAYRPVVAHAGLVHPGEPVPRSVPDARTLRLRVLMHAPGPALVAALLLLHRQRPERVTVVEERVGWAVKVPAGEPVPLLDWLAGFAAGRGWCWSRGPGPGLGAPVLVRVLEALGVATAVGRTLVLAEPLFARLATEAEELEVAARLQPLAEAIDASFEPLG